MAGRVINGLGRTVTPGGISRKCPCHLMDGACGTGYIARFINLTMFDKLQKSRADASREDLIRMNNLAAAIYMTSQGVPFLQAGEEMLRTKVNANFPQMPLPPHGWSLWHRIHSPFHYH